MSEFLVVNSKKGPKIAVPGLFFWKSRSDCSLELILRLRGQKRMQRDGANLQHLFLAIFYYKTGEKTKKMAFFAAANGPKAIYIYFWHFPKHRLIKNPFCCNPPFDQKMIFLKFFVLKPKTFMLNRKHNLKSGKSKAKKKELETKKGRKLKKDKWFQKKKLAI